MSELWQRALKKRQKRVRRREYQREYMRRRRRRIRMEILMLRVKRACEGVEALCQKL